MVRADQDHRHPPHNNLYPCPDLLLRFLLYSPLFPSARSLGHRRRRSPNPVFPWRGAGGDNFRSDSHKDQQIPWADLGSLVLYDIISRVADYVGRSIKPVRQLIRFCVTLVLRGFVPLEPRRSSSYSSELSEPVLCSR